MERLLGVIVFGLIGPISISVSAQNIHGVTGLSVLASDAGDKISFVIKNTSGRDVPLELPVIIAMDGNLSGIEYVIRNASGVRYNMCANINLREAPSKQKLIANSDTQFSVRYDHLVTVYCLEPGSYILTGIFHHVIDGRIVGPDLVSNDIRFSVPIRPSEKQ